MKASPAMTIQGYLNALPRDTRAALEKLRAAIKAAAPGAEEVISYQMPAFRYKGRLLVSFAAFKDHCSFFPMSSRVLDTFEAAIKGRVSKGTIHFPVDAPLSAALVRKVVKARIREIEEKRKSRASSVR